MTEILFSLSFALAAPVWALMILAPGWRWTERVAASTLPLLPIIAVYLALAVPAMPELWAAVRSPELAKWQHLLDDAGGAAAIWAQVIAWDLFIGQWIYREGRRLAVHPVLMGPVLVLSILLSPIGVLLFLAIRAVAGHRARIRTRPEARATAPDRADEAADPPQRGASGDQVGAGAPSRG